MAQKCIRCGQDARRDGPSMCGPCSQAIELFTEARERLIATLGGGDVGTEVANAIDCYIDAKRELLW